MTDAFYRRIDQELAGIRSAGLFKPERVLLSPQGPQVQIAQRGGAHAAINLCAKNYLGLASDPRVVEGAIAATRNWGAGTASVRFICGTLGIHKELETAIADYLGHDDAILFAAAFDANGGVFETLLTDKDAVVSDSLNHASIIDGVRLSKARRYRFDNGDMDALETALRTARQQGAETILIVTDGVFSMDGYLAKLPDIVRLARAHDALVMVDDCHATGFVGPGGRGSAAACGVEDGIDIITGTFGKALGGSMGGFIAARQTVVDLLRQRARPYLFSNALAPAICGASIAAIAIASSAEGDALRQRLHDNATRFRSAMTAAGFDLLPGEHPIIPVMLGDAASAAAMAADMVAAGVLVTAFSFPVVPKGKARIRTQMSAALTPEDIDTAVAVFTRVRVG
jgi:glycine C-acetyltransferase